jgi:hypothetical protein
MTVRHWDLHTINTTLALAPSLCVPLGVTPSSQCISGSGAFNSAPTTLAHCSPYKYTSLLFISFIKPYSFFHNIQHRSFLFSNHKYVLQLLSVR